MKSLFSLFVAASISLVACGQGNPPASPAATAKQTLDNGATVTVSYGQPSVKGRTIGDNLEPMSGKVWRAGANKATVFETDKDLTIEGQALKAGKYGFFVIVGDNGAWTFIFNKTWDQWGAYSYKEADDVARIPAKTEKGTFSEKLTYTIDKNGKMTINWGDNQASVMIK
ncbi:MAG: DUF2911 domain-containing protein [Chitinophagaceae bacterium]|nr:DUF2911 domain-containing protein [Chitinophagaceae bacterium]